MNSSRLTPGLLAEAQELAFEADQLAVEVVDLLDELLDAAVVELDRAHMAAELGGELDDLALRLGRGLHAFVRRLQPLIEQLVDLLEGGGDLVEGLDHAGQELLLHGGERNIRLLAGFAFRFALAFRRLDHHLDLGRLALDGLALGGDGRGGGIRAAAISGVEVDDVTQQHLALAQALAPIEQSAIGERALGDAADHHVAPGLDALGDRDLALAGEQLDAAHLAQIHAHGIVGAADIGVVEIAGGALAALFLFAARPRPRRASPPPCLLPDRRFRRD
jgi:hypothetical protein